MSSDTLPEILEATQKITSSGEIPFEKITELYNFSHQLVATDALDVLLDSVVHYAVEITQVSFCRLFTFDNDQVFSCKSAHFNNEQKNIKIHNSDIEESKVTQNFLKEKLYQNTPHFITRTDVMLTLVEENLLETYSSEFLCIAPMKTNSEKVGLLILGHDQCIGKKDFCDNNLRLICLISDLAASAIHRASLSKILKSNEIETVLALAKTIEARDPYTGGHSKKVVDLAVKTAVNLNLPASEIQFIRMAAFLHDIGKIGVPDEILHKPGPLNDEEWAVMKKHPDVGADIVLSVSKLAHVAPLIRFHHEKYDGSGYPYGLKGEWIPLGARIIKVVDAYSAITDGRVYKPAQSHEDAIKEITYCSGREFDPKVIRAFISSFE